MNVLVYGTLRKDGSFNHVLKDTTPISTCIVSGFKMYDLGPYPGVVMSKNSSHQVVCERYEVTTEKLKEIDKIMRYPMFCDRRWISNAYFYFFEPWELSKFTDKEPIEDGDWIKYVSKINKK